MFQRIPVFRFSFLGADVMLMGLQKSEKATVFLCLLVILLFVAPLFVLGEDAHIRVHDNLDSNLAWYKVLTSSGELFGSLDARIPQMINGLPRYALASELSGIVWLHALFPTMIAYACSQLITRVFAFLGMYLLLKDFVPKHLYRISAGVALAFSLTPFWPSGMLSTLGQPLALWAFLRIRRGQASWKEWVTILLLPFYSSLVLGFFFFLTGVGVIWAFDLFMKRRLNPPFLLSIVLMCSMFLLVEYRLVYDTLFSDETIHRVEFISSRHDFVRTLRLSLKNFLLGHNHVMTVHTAVILPVHLFTLFLVFSRREWRQEKLIVGLFFLNYLLSFWYALWFNVIWIPLKEKLTILNTFNFARFHFLRPLVIYFSFGLSLHYLWKRAFRRLVYLAIIGQIIVLIPFNEEIHYGLIHKTPSFKEFYAERQFQEIADFIGLKKEEYRIASIGLHPAIAQFNGFYTLDTYSNMYPLEYKYEFREIIAKELAKSKQLRTYFDEWGSRCYIFVAELGKKYDFKKSSKKTVKNLELNTEKFYEMGGRYFISSVAIENAAENGMILLKIFDHPESAWRIYLYEVVPPFKRNGTDIREKIS